MSQKKIILREDEMPKQWYNICPDIPNGMQPPLDPGTKEPMAPEKLAAIFPMGLLEQEMSPNRWIDIPDEVREIYSIWRPSPLIRGEGRQMEYISLTSSGISIQRLGLISCSRSPMGKIAASFSGAIGSLVPGSKGGCMPFGISGQILYHCLGISSSRRIIFF